MVLERGMSIVVPERVTPFVARDFFEVTAGHTAVVKISSIWKDFTTRFLSGAGKIESAVPAQRLHFAPLRVRSCDAGIVNDIGGETRVETMLAEIYCLMRWQRNGESGLLVKNHFSNIFYVKDMDNILRLVFVRWCGRGWTIGTGPVPNPFEWYEGNQVFFRTPITIDDLM